MMKNSKAKTSMTETPTEEVVKGVPEIEIDGQKYKIEFNWTTYGEARTALGGEPDMMNPVVLSQYAAFGLKRHHPMVTAEQLMTASPAMIPVAQGIRAAVTRLFWGDNPPSTST